MKVFSSIKTYDAVSDKNAEESETRSEMTTAADFDSQYLNIRNIHNKRKEYR